MSAHLCLNETFQVTVSHNSLQVQCEAITFVLDWNLDDYMFDDVRNLLSVAFETLSHRVKVIVIKEGNSIITVCSFPVQLASQLIAKAFKNLKPRFGLLRLTIGYEINKTEMK